VPKQSRGEGWVIAQMLLILAVVIIPPELAGEYRLPNGSLYVGIALAILGGAVGLAGIRHLGSNLTPFPKPKDDATLIQSGIYSVVRHPIYAGIFTAAVGYALMRASIPTLLQALVLGVFFDQKARFEEAHLRQLFSEYAEYAKKVRGRILPF
jgi:protein-S-isoprenylcysteine O-methyltransferase Ste14